jgi:CHAT domain-containing protein
MATKRHPKKPRAGSTAKRRGNKRKGPAAFKRGERRPDRVTHLWLAADAAREAAEASDNATVIDRAIKLHESLLGIDGFAERADKAGRATVIMNLGTLLMRRWSLNRGPNLSGERAARAYTDVRRAVDCFEMCQTLAPRMAELWGPSSEQAKYFLIFMLQDDAFENGNAEAAEQAVSISRMLSEKARSQQIRKATSGHLPSLLLTHYELTGVPPLLSEAQRLLASPSIRHDAHWLATSLHALYHQYELDGDVAHLNESICTAEDMLKNNNTPDADENVKSLILLNLAVALSARYQYTGRPADLDHAIQIGEQLTGHNQSRAKSNLCAHHVQKYLHVGEIANIDAAVDCARAAVGSACSSSDEHLANMWLCIASRAHYSRYGDAAMLNESIQAGQRALKICPDAHVHRPGILVHLGVAVLHRYQLNGDVTDLDCATRLLEESRTCGNITSSVRDTQAAALSGVYMANYRRFGAIRYLELGIGALEDAAANVSSASHPLALCLGNLAVLKTERALKTRSPADISDTVHTYRRFAREAANASPPTALNTTRQWARWAISRGEWAEAGEAIELAMNAASQLYERQVAREEREENLSDAAGLGALAALIYTERGAYDQAVAAIEKTRCILFSEVVARRAPELQDLADAGNGELVRRYQEAVAGIDGLESLELSLAVTDVTKGPTAQQIRDAREELRKVRQDIRSLPGFEHFNELPDIESIRSCARDHGTVVYLVHTEWTGLALSVDPDTGDVAAIKLPQANSTEIAKILRAYEAGRIGNNALEWQEALARTIDWCGQCILSPIVEALNPARLILIPTGDVGLLPLHASRVMSPDGSVENLVDCLDITYAPNARMLGNKAQKQMSHFLGVADPKPSKLPALKSGVSEIEAGAGYFNSTTLLSHTQATPESVMSEIAAANVVHFACHGIADPEAALDSALHLAYGTRLMLRDVVSKDLSGIALVVLSACETALISPELPDEVLGLPAGFMQSGATGVIASSWAVPDQAAAATMIRFYHEWQNGKLSGSQALSRAARWVRDSTNGQKAAFLSTYGLDYGADVPPDLREQWQARRAHEDPQYWCGFSYWGN